MVWLVESFGRDARAAVRLENDALWEPSKDTIIAPSGAIILLLGRALTVAVVIGPVVVPLLGGKTEEGPINVYDGCALYAARSSHVVSPIHAARLYLDACVSVKLVAKLTRFVGDCHDPGPELLNSPKSTPEVCGFPVDHICHPSELMCLSMYEFMYIAMEKGEYGLPR